MFVIWLRKLNGSEASRSATVWVKNPLKTVTLLQIVFGGPPGVLGYKCFDKSSAMVLQVSRASRPINTEALMFKSKQ